MLWLLSACSFQVYEKTLCTSSAECRSFGVGNICEQNEDDDLFGYCVEASSTPRCFTSYPEGILTEEGSNWSDHQEDLLIGALFDRTSDQANIDAVNLAAKQIADFGGLESQSFSIIHCSYEDDADGEIDGLTGEAAVQAAGEATDGAVAALLSAGEEEGDAAGCTTHPSCKSGSRAGNRRRPRTTRRRSPTLLTRSRDPSAKCRSV